MLDGFEIIRRSKEVNANLVTFLFQDRRPALRDGSCRVHLGHGLLPRGLMADFRVHVGEAIIRDDLRRLEMLELGRVRTRVLGEADERLGALHIAVVVGGDVRDEVGGMVLSDGVVVDFEFHGVLRVELQIHFIVKFSVYNLRMSIHILTDKATSSQVQEMLEAFLEMRMIKIVVDIKREILAGGSGMHYECEQLLLEQGCEQEDLWGANWFPDEQSIEFESLINIRPRQNRNIIIQDENICKEVERVTRNVLEGVKP